MERFKNILLLTHDVRDLDVTLARAVALAEDNGGSLTIVKVEREIPPDLEATYASMGLADLGDLGELVSRERRLMIRGYATPVVDGRVPVDIQVRFGVPFLEVSQMVEDEGHDLVITTAEEAGGEGIIGPTTMGLMRRCPCPVWLLRPGRKSSRHRRVLAAVKLESEDDLGLEVNHEVLDLAASMARAERAELHVVLAWSIYGEGLLRSRNRLSGDEQRQLNECVQADRQQLLDELLALHGLPVWEDEVHLVKGDPAVVIPDLAEQQRVDLVVMGTVAHAGIRRLLMGNTAERALQRVSCSVLAVKPPRFVARPLL